MIMKRIFALFFLFGIFLAPAGLSYAGEGLTAWEKFADGTLADADLIAGTDVSDTTQSPEGSSKAFTFLQLRTALATYFAAVLGADDNYVTDAEKIVIGNTSGTNTGDNATNSQYSGLAASKLDTNGSAANLTSFPTLNQNTTGTAAGLSGTPNITVGTISAGAGGFGVDADGDTTVKSMTQTKASGAAGDLGLYEANSTDTHAAGWRGPASIAGDGAYRGQFANAGPAEATIMVWGAQGSGDGTAASPYIHAVPFVTLSPLFTVSGSALAFASTANPNMAGISFGTDPSVAGGGGPRLSNNMAIYWKAASGSDIPIAVDSSDIIQMGQNADGINLNSAPVTGLSLNTGGTNNAITVPFHQCFPILTPANADDVNVWEFRGTTTITSATCTAIGGGTIPVEIHETDANGANGVSVGLTFTCGATKSTDSTPTDTSIAAGNYARLVFTADATGTVGEAVVCLDGTEVW